MARELQLVVARELQLVVSEAEFRAYCLRLEAARAEAGAGTSARVGIGQRVDALEVIHALNRSRSWLLPDEDPGKHTARAVFARHMAPILCESPAMREALDSLDPPGRFSEVVFAPPPEPHPPAAPSRPPPAPEWWDRFAAYMGGELRSRLVTMRDGLVSRPAQFLSVMGLLTTGALYGTLNYTDLPCRVPESSAWLRSWSATEGCTAAGDVVDMRPEVAVVEGGSGSSSRKDPPPASPNPGVSLGPLDRALGALSVVGYDLSPALLAQHLAATSALDLDPALYLDAMLARWPMAADRPITRSKAGAMGLLNFALAVATLERDRVAAETIRSRMTGIDRPRVLAVDVSGVYLPDLALPGDTGLPSVTFFADIDTRLARLAVDETASALLALHLGLTGKIVPGSQPVIEIENPGGVPLLDQPYDPFVLEQMRLQAADRFGVAISADDAVPGETGFADLLALVQGRIAAAAPLDDSFATVLEPWRRGLGFLPLAVPLVAFLWAAFGYPGAMRRRLRDWPDVPPRALHMVVPARSREPPPSAETRRIALILRHSPPFATSSLNVEGSLVRSLARGGYFTPVMRTRRNVVTHLVLIHRRTMAEHEPRRIAALFGQLRAAGVPMAIYEYAGDPRRLRPFDRAGGAARDLWSVQDEFPDARLILVTRGEEFAGTGAHAVAAATLDTLLRWQERVVVTPVPVGDWGVREWRVSARLLAPLARAGAEGLPDLARIFPAEHGVQAVEGRVADTGLARWLRQAVRPRLAADGVPSLPRLLAMSEAEAAVPEADDMAQVGGLTKVLRRWLGAAGYLWLQACAAYPALRYPLTRWLGEELFDGRAPERALAQMTQLAWFAVGRMPAALAAKLRDELKEPERQRIGAILERFYATRQDGGIRPDEGSGSRYASERIAFEPEVLSGPPEVVRGVPGDLQEAGTAAARVRAVRRAVLADRAAVIAGAGVLALALAAVWPDRFALPLAPGAWLPVAAVLVVGVVSAAVGGATLAALRRARTGWGR